MVELQGLELRPPVAPLDVHGHVRRSLPRIHVPNEM
jgi:hypothetical protein